MFNNFRIKSVLKISVAFVLATLLFSAFINHAKMGVIIENTQRQKVEILPNLLDFLELQLYVVEIQQWLTDVSATRAAEGFDDGYAEAQAYFTKANTTLDRLIQMHADLGEDALVGRLQKYKNNLKEYYAVGVRMADAYVKHGPKEGNKLMLELDPFAAKLSEELEVWISEHKEELTAAGNDINESI